MWAEQGGCVCVLHQTCFWVHTGAVRRFTQLKKLTMIMNSLKEPSVLPMASAGDGPRGPTGLVLDDVRQPVPVTDPGEPALPVPDQVLAPGPITDPGGSVRPAQVTMCFWVRAGAVRHFTQLKTMYCDYALFKRVVLLTVCYA